MQNRTIAEIEKIILDLLEAQFNFKIPLLSKAFNRVLSRVLAAVWQINYKTANWIFLQLFVSSASFKSVTIFGKTITPLIEWGRLVGAGDPLPSSAARLQIEITVNSPGEILDSGSQFNSTINNLLYITAQNYTLSGATQLIEVVCVQGGTAGNLTAGDPISLVNPLGIIQRDAVVDSVLLAGVDPETEADYRARVSERFKQRPQGGALIDYRIWSSEVPGVLQSYWYTGDIPTYVIGYIAGDSAIYADRIPTNALLLEVGDSIDFSTDSDGNKVADRRPVGAIIDPAGDKSYGNLYPVTIRGFEVNIIDLNVSDISGVKTSISNALNAYFLEREPYIEGLSFPPVKNTIQQSAVIGIVQTIVQAANGTFLDAIVSEDDVVTPATTIGEGQLSKLDIIKYDGV